MERVEDHNLTDTLQKLVMMKQMRAKTFFIMLPLVVLWFMWTGIEMWQYVSTITEDFILAGAVYGGCVGGIIGGILGIFITFRIYRKMQNTNDELIAQISGFSSND